MKLRTFQMRILLWSWGVLLVALAVIFYYSTSLVHHDLIQETEERSTSELDTVKWLIIAHGQFSSNTDFAQWVDGIGTHLGARITYVSKGGQVLADSVVKYTGLDLMDDHSERPEIIQAHIDGRGSNIRYSDTLRKEMLYVAVKLKDIEGLPDGILRLAVPFSIVSERINSLRINFIWVFLITLAATALLSAIMSRNISREITTFSQLAKSIGDGDYGTRIRILPGGEFMSLAQSVNTMAKSIERNVRLIEDQKGELQAIFEGMREGVMSIDAKGRIESFNAALDTMFNLAESSIGRTPIEVTRRCEIQDLVDEMIHDSNKGRKSIQLELMDSRTVEVSAVPSLDDGSMRKIILVFYDITDLKRSEKGLKDFVANASHQLRTPLTSIKGYTETLLDNPPANPDDAKLFLGTVLKNADHMDKVISSMLDLAKSEQIGKKLRLEPISGREFMNRTLDDVAPWAAERNITLTTRTPNDAMLVMGEPDGLLHVFHNLLNNAVKYSPDNGIITVSAEDDGESLVFTIEDQGPGISREHSTKIFERFYRVDENTIDSSGSSGLGLAICRRIVRNFDGEIWHDGYGEGTRGARFCFRLNKPISSMDAL